MPNITINDSSMYYETVGEGLPLLLISGFGCDVTYWGFIAPALSTTFKLILFDNRCAGRSACKDEPITIQQMAADAAALLDHLNIPKAHVLGHSMGGAIAQSLAYQFPKKVDKLILAHSVFKISPRVATVAHLLLGLREENIPLRREIQAFMPWLFSNDFLSIPAKREYFIEVKANEPFPISLIGLRRQFEAMLQFDPLGWYEEISTPTLVLGGEEDLLCPPKDSHVLAKGIKGSRIYIFPRQAHSTPLEQPEEFCRVILDYLTSQKK